jgi:hypothetical protein
MKQAKTAIHREMTVAIPALKVRNGRCIRFRLYPSIRRNNLDLGYQLRVPRLWTSGRVRSVPLANFFTRSCPPALGNIVTLKTWQYVRTIWLLPH